MMRAEEYMYKQNFIALAKEHKKKCKGYDCKIQLLSLLLALDEMKINLTKKERKEFI